MTQIIRIGVNAFQGIRDTLSSATSSRSFNPYKLLLIGETGSGKTSFLNLLCNYATVKELGLEKGIEKFRDFKDIELENAQSKKMESKTNGTALYNTKLNSLEIGIIDTPGFGDSRGMNEDKRHTEKIIAALEEVEHVNCICLVINGRASRMTVTLRYVLAEITAILPKEVLNNVVVVFTNTSNLFDLNFEIDTLAEFFGKQIENSFMIDNPYCHFEKAKKMQGKIPQKLLAQSLKDGLKNAGTVLDEMYKFIKDLKAVHTKNFIELYGKKQQIEGKLLDLLAAYDSQVKLTKQMKKAKEEVEAAQNKKQLNKDFQTYQTNTRWIRVSTPSHNTLCGAPGCYKTCHENCGLPKSYDREVFKSCAGVGGKTCNTCGDSYLSHYHNEVKMVEKTETIPLIDAEMKRRFEEADNADKIAAITKQTIEMHINKAEAEKKDLSNKLLLIMEEFHQLGLNRNYAKLLESHLFAVQQRKEDSTTEEDIKSLTTTEKEIQKKLDLVKITLNEPWSPKADVTVQKQWACKMLKIQFHSKFTIAEINQAYKRLARASHPDKQHAEDDTMKKINRAKEILEPLAS